MRTLRRQSPTWGRCGWRFQLELLGKNTRKHSYMTTNFGKPKGKLDFPGCGRSGAASAIIVHKEILRVNNNRVRRHCRDTAKPDQATAATATKCGDTAVTYSSETGTQAYPEQITEINSSQFARCYVFFICFTIYMYRGRSRNKRERFIRKSKHKIFESDHRVFLRVGNGLQEWSAV